MKPKVGVAAEKDELTSSWTKLVRHRLTTACGASAVRGIPTYVFHHDQADVVFQRAIQGSPPTGKDLPCEQSSALRFWVRYETHRRIDSNKPRQRPSVHKRL